MQAQKYSIKEWAKDDRPREKLRSRGPQVLSDSELLAILLRNGPQSRSAVDLARDILSITGNDLNELGKLTVAELMKVRGVGAVKAITIAAALELGRRRHSGASEKSVQVKSSAEIAAYLQPLLRDLRHEVFGVVFLNRANRVKRFEIVSNGGITSTVADPRIILKKTIEEEAVAIILVHNHPSGSLHPSRADKDFTEKIVGAARLLDIRVTDHIIVSDEGYFSFADEGLI